MPEADPPEARQPAGRRKPTRPEPRLPTSTARSRVAALAASTHPGPTVAVTVIAAVLSIAVGLDAVRAAIVTLVVVLNQLSIGLSNDWLDAARDRENGRADKAIARGDISVAAVRGAAIATAAASLVLGLIVGVGTGLANLGFVAAGWFYNAGVKATVFATLMYAIGFGALPAIVTLARPEPALPAVWALALGALLGVAAHFANVLPDLGDDARTSIRALPHLIGARPAGVTTFLVLLAASVLAFVGPAGGPSAVQWAGLSASIGIAIAGIVLVLIRPPSRLLFRLIIAAALVDVVVLATAGGRMLG